MFSILDANLHCHVAFTHRDAPAVVPMLHWRDEDHLYLHGSGASRLLKEIAGQPVCVCVTQLDGLVLARSAFHHSANFRSVCIYGTPEPVASEEMRRLHLRHMMEGLFPGRWDALRPVRTKEIRATQVLALSLTEASAKVRSGSTDEDPKDLEWPVWAGVAPMTTALGALEPDPIAAGKALSPPTLGPRLGGRR